VKLVFSHILDYGGRSELASQAAECAGDQGRFWEMHDRMFEQQSLLWGPDERGALEQIATGQKLDLAQFNNCLDSKKYLDKVRQMHLAAKQAGIRIRPTFDINGQRVQGALAYEPLSTIIDGLLPK
jgi:protein-disulfide isomerase